VFSSSVASVIIAAKRLWNQRLLMLCLLVGLITAVGLLSSIPLYADAVHLRLLQGELTEAGTYRPPFAFLWRYVGAWHGEIAWDALAPADEYLSRQAIDIIDLPLDFQVRHVRTGNLRLFPAGDSGFRQDEPLLWTSIGFISGLEDHIDLVEGTYPQGTGDEVEALISQATAEQLGLQVGERYVLFASGSSGVQLPVRIVGVWRALDETGPPEAPSADPFWFYQPASFDEILLTTEAAFQEQVVPPLDEPVALAVWYQVFDGSRMHTSDVPDLLNQVVSVEARVTALLNNTTLDVSPVAALSEYGQSARLLAVILSIFSIPVMGVVLFFVGLIASMVVRRGQTEIAVLRSRGTTRAQVVGVYLLEGLLVGSVGLIGGLALGRWLAQLMGHTRTFLDPALLSGLANRSFSDPLPVSLSPAALRYGLLGVALAVLALLAPSLVASRHTIVTYKWERARALIRPLWQRYYLDLFLLALPLYGWYLLQGQGTVALLGQGDDPFSNPLLFLVPVLFSFSLALLFARIFPLLMGACAWLAKGLPGTTLLLALRQLSRSASQYVGPLLLLTLTLCLATFSASMATTMDGHLKDQSYYQVGADLKLVELGESTEQPEGQTLPGQTSPSRPSEGNEEPRWLFLPVSEHLRVPGVLGATRVGDYSATSNIGGRQQTGRLLGVDRADLPAAAFFRPDFAAGESLGGLMNRLAVNWPNILANRDFLARNRLAVGDPLRLTVGAAGEFREIEFTVAGPLDLFPTLYPQDGPFFVANLEYIYESLGGTYPYDVWLATDPAVPTEDVIAGVRSLGLSVVTASDARALIDTEQTRPERQGLFGLLSAGFLAAAALTVLGFLVYAVVSFRQRFIELGMLRAIGLSVWQMATYLAGEQAILILTGIGLGTGLGVWTSSLFIPFLQVGTGKTAQVPPFVVQIAWDQIWIIYAVFGTMYVLAVSVLLLLLIRMRVFEAVKLGETV
jgi:putative ABC transport system permease protein